MTIRSFTASAAALFVLALPLILGAQAPDPSTYLLVDDLPFVSDSKVKDISTYLQAIFNLGMGLAVTLAIVVIVYNGINYMVSESAGAKGAAKIILKNAVVGLLIIFGSYLILYTINPELTQFNLTNRINEVVEAIKKQQAERPLPPTGGGDDDEGTPWPSDAAERARLTAANIGFNNPNCTHVGQKNCTSVAGLSAQAIEGLINLKSRCDAAISGGCSLIITGGTEHWAHKTHGDNRTVDLRNSSSLTSYIGGMGNKCFDPKTKDNLTFYWEDARCGPGVYPHWHVKF